MFQVNFDKAWLRYLIDSRDVSLTELARRMGVALQTVSDFMTGKRRPNDRMLAKIFDALDMTLSEAQAAYSELKQVVEVDNGAD